MAMRKLLVRSAGVLGGLALLAPTAAWAHTGVGPADGLIHGMLHPLLGVDHLLAMIAVGVWATQLGGRAVVALPAAFVATMAIGAAAGAAGFAMPGVEAGILLSVLSLGALAAAAKRLPIALAMAVVAIFALFHGHAHGTEMPATIAGWAYGMGFVTATAALHAAGIGLVLAARSVRPVSGLQWDRIAGATIAAAGLILWIV
jgi:urease accessory protein